MCTECCKKRQIQYACWFQYRQLLVPVRTRVVYNSNVKKSNISGLPARGKQVKISTTGVVCRYVVNNQVGLPSLSRRDKNVNSDNLYRHKVS